MKTEPNAHIVIDANDRSSSFSWQKIRPYADLLRSFVLRDWKVRFGQTRLGFLWMILQPLITASLLTLVFGLLVQRGNAPIPYPLFVLSGWMGWTFFSSASLQSVQLIPQYQAMMRKVYFPKAILPLSKLIGLLPEFCIALLMTLIYGAVSGSLSIRALSVPLFFPLLLFFVFGTVAWFSALGGGYRDIQQLAPYTFQMLFFLSPVAYPFGLLGQYLPEWGKVLLYLNPMAGCIDLFRYLLFDGFELHSRVLWSAAVALLLAVSGAQKFAREERKWTEGL